MLPRDYPYSRPPGLDGTDADAVEVVPVERLAELHKKNDIFGCFGECFEGEFFSSSFPLVPLCTLSLSLSLTHSLSV